MKSLTYRTVFLALAAAFALSPAANAAIVVNGGFETGDFTGWTLFGNTGSGFVGVDGSAPQSGSYGAYFGPVGSIGGISQLVATTPGAAYNIDFWLRSEADVTGLATPNSFTFGWGGTPVISLANVAAGNYIHYTSHLLATSALTSLTFSFQDDPAFFDLDSIAVAASVPEPGSLPLLACGGLAVLAYRRRQRQQQRG